MRRFFAATILGLAFTAVVAGSFILYEYSTSPDVIRGDYGSIKRFVSFGLEKAAQEGRIGCAGLVFVEAGKVSLARCFGRPNSETACDPETSLFTVASVSKAATALGAMKLADDKVVGLDEPILPQLKRWRFPQTSEEFKSEVTVRHLMSHTAGIVDGFGTGGFVLDSALQSLPEYLSLPMHTNMGPPHNTVVTSKPGTTFSYSTMGYVVFQLMVEDKLGIPFHRFMSDSVLRPLGIARSSYDITEIIERGDANHLVDNYDRSLISHPHERHVGQAGAGLKLTVNDFGKLISAFIANPILDDSAMRQMCGPQPGTFGSWGLGLELFGETKSIVGHSGGSFPRSGAAFRLNPDTGNGIGIMMTGGTEMIDPYMSAWMYWETGEKQFDIREVFHKHIVSVAVISIIGFIFISILIIRIM